MQTVIRWGLALLVLAPVAWTQDGSADVSALKKKADAALEAAQKAETARDEAKDAWTEKSDDKDLEKKKDETEAAYQRALDDLEAAADALSDAGGEAKEYRVYLNESGRAQADLGAALGLAEKWMGKAKDWLVNSGPGVLMAIVKFLVILLIFKWLASFAGKVVTRAVGTARLKVSDLLKNFFVNVTTKVIFFAGLMIALESVGVPMGPLLAGVGVLGFVVGFALQDTLGNFASGIMILLYRPFDVGNVVNVAGMTGKVDAMTLVSTTLVLPDNQVVMIPNNKIWGDTITNITARATRRVDMVIGVSYGDDLDKAQDVLLDEVKKHPKVLEEPAPTIRVTALADSSVNFVVRPWCNTSDYWDVYWDLHKAIKQRLDAEDISIPFPQRDVHIHETK